MAVANYLPALTSQRKTTFTLASEEGSKRLGRTGNSFQAPDDSRDEERQGAGVISNITNPLIDRRKSSLKQTDTEETSILDYIRTSILGENETLKTDMQEYLDQNPLAIGGVSGGASVNSDFKFSKKVKDLKNDETFMSRLDDLIAKNTGLTEGEVFRIIQGESGGNTKAVSGAGAVTLFQMIPKVVEELGFTTEELKIMSAADQLSVYEEYLDRWDYDGSYGLGILQAAPAYRNSSADTVIYKKGSPEWKQNKVWRSANNGPITKRSIEAYYGRTE